MLKKEIAVVVVGEVWKVREEVVVVGRREKEGLADAPNTDSAIAAQLLDLCFDYLC